MKKAICLLLTLLICSPVWATPFSWGSNYQGGEPEGGGGAVEGTDVLSTGETGGTKFLREDGDGTSSWQKIRVEVQMVVFDFATNTATGDGKFYFHIGNKIGSSNLVSVHAEVITAGTTNTTTIQVYNVDNAVDMLSTLLSVDSGETGSDTAATPAVINTSNDDVDENDVLRIDVDQVSSTPAVGLIVTLGFEPR